MMKLKNIFMLAAVSLMSAMAVAQNVAIIPQPYHIDQQKGTVVLGAKPTVEVDDASLMPAAQYLSDAFEAQTGTKLKVVSKGGDIRLCLAKDGEEGAYSLKVERGGVTMSGSGYTGIINAIATLRQLLPMVKGEKVVLPKINVSDRPRYVWRGLMVDCSRHFYTVDELKKLIDVMAYYKLNRFHWHLTDDQGWRVEVKRYPLLTVKGAWRRFNNQDSLCMANAAKEDMPNLLLPESKIRTTEDGTQEYGGFYTQDDVRDIVAYAAKRGIDVVPEIDMPGHSLAAIESYDGLSCFDQTGWGRLFTTPMCPGKDKMLEFCRNVWTEMFALFPFEYVHIGGDEVDMKNWKKCADCQKRMADNGLTTEPQLQTWFNHYMEAFFRENGKKMIAWDDVIDGGLSPYTTVMWWRSWLPKGPKLATSHGNDLIDVPVSFFYLSTREDDTKLPGIYNFNPYETLNENEAKLVKGLHSCLWGERVASVERMWYQLFPRLTAVAEKAWSMPERMNYDDFTKRLLTQLPRLEAMGVKYRLPDLTGLNRGNVFVSTDTVKVACIDPSVTIRYTKDGTMPQQTSPVYTGPMAVTETTHFVFRAFGRDGRKGDAFRSDFVKDQLHEAVTTEQQLQTGLSNLWYDYPGDWCKGIEEAPLKGEYVTDGVCIPKEAKENIGLVITGYLEVPEDGVYTFRLYSDDGSQLTVDGVMVVDNDGMHDARELVGQHAMKKGLHPIRVLYFDHNGGDLRLKVEDKHGKEVKVRYWH